jgi:hypothetical protein
MHVAHAIMKLEYFANTDSLSVEFREQPTIAVHQEQDG